MNAFGTLVLTPPSVWRSTHNYHHAHTAKIVGSHIGSYAMLTVDLWRRATPTQRLAYRATRHPLTMALGYATIFLYGMCLAPFLRDRRKHRDGLVALVAHVAVSVLAWWALGPVGWALVVIVPLGVACALGSYLFYAQHNFPGIVVQPRESWSYATAALASSSYMEMGPVMAFFTGNIGYHHVHHLNPGIPFYRLPEAMAALPALQHPTRTSLWPRDVAACLALKLWDPARGRMVDYRSTSSTSGPS
jgi:omega-6 fatty acid desaturase (delta-12 desaturase)